MSASLIRLSDDIIISHILTRLPVKTLGRCRCVCKSWKYILSDPDSHFITCHINHTSKHPDYECLIMSMIMDHRYDGGSVHILSRSRLSYTRVDNFPSGILIGSINGLVCVNYKHLFLLWNPVTGLAKTIVPPQQYFKTQSQMYCGSLISGLCWDDVESQYKIVMGYKDTNSLLHGFVYASNYDVWDQVFVPIHVLSHKYVYNNPAIIVGGCPYWIIVSQKPESYVTKFETISNQFKEYSIPCEICLGLDGYNLVEVNNRVAVMVYSPIPPTLAELFHLDEECGVWSKTYSLNPTIHEFAGMISQCFKYGGEIVFGNGEKLYDPKTNEIKVISDAVKIWSSYSYTPSFVFVHGMKPLLTQSHWTPSQRPVYPYAQSHRSLLYKRLDRYLRNLLKCFDLA